MYIAHAVIMTSTIASTQQPEGGVPYAYKLGKKAIFI